MSDAELNELSAIKVMGWINKGTDHRGITLWMSKDDQSKYVHFEYDGALDWNPTTDMNDAMELWNKLHSESWELSLSCDQKVTYPWDCRMFLLERKRVISHEKTASRAITIASILAKE